MVNALHKLSRTILNIIAWPLMVFAIVMSGLAFNAAGWQFTNAETGAINYSGIIFTVGCAVFGLKIIAIFIPPLREISKIIFSVASCVTVCLLAYVYGVQFRDNYNWTLDYSGTDAGKASLFWGFGFIGLCVLLGIYALTGLMWLCSFRKKKD